MATIKDVAALAGISYTTVSHVVNKSRPVSDPVRLKVEAAIAQLDYVPSAVARSLKARSTATIGLLVPNSINPYFAELARGIEDYCERKGYCVILCNSDDDSRKQRNYIRVLLEKRVDGLIVSSVGGENTLAQSLAATRTPLIILDRVLPGVEADLVCIDNEQGGYLATRHLLELGHRDIACVTGPLHTSAGQQRLAGFQRAMAEAGLTEVSARIIEGDFSSPGGYDAAARLLGDGAPTAIFACNDLMGLGVLRAAAERNVRVPEQLSVVGFDDIQICRFVYPALTTVGQSIRLLGETAAERLLQRVRLTVTGAPEQRLVAPAIVRRESTAALGKLFDEYR